MGIKTVLRHDRSWIENFYGGLFLYGIGGCIKKGPDWSPRASACASYGIRSHHSAYVEWRRW